MQVNAANIDREELRSRISAKYTEVAKTPGQGFHFHTGRPLASMLGYDAAEIDALPESTVESFAGTGNPFSMGRLRNGEAVLDMGCGAGLDTLLAAAQVGPNGSVVAVDMTEAMIEKTGTGAVAMGYDNVVVKRGLAEHLPVESESIDVLISNGVINLCPDKIAVLSEMFRVLKPGGRFQIGDVVVHKAIPQNARDDIDLWAG